MKADATKTERRSEKPFISLRTKFIAFISLVIIAVCSGLSLYVIRQQAQVMAESLIKTGVMIVHNLAYNSRYSLITQDRPTLERLVDGVLEVDEVVYVAMSDHQGKTFLWKSKRPLVGQERGERDPNSSPSQHSRISESLIQSTLTEPLITTLDAGGRIRDHEDGGPNSAGTLLGLSPANELLFDFAIPVRRKALSEPVFGPLGLDALEVQDATIQADGPTRPVGVVQVGLTNGPMLLALHGMIQNVALITLLIIVVGIVLVTVLANRIVTPLRKLTDLARQVASGDLTARATATTSDEVGQLTTVFNAMTQALQQREQAITTQMSTISRQVKQLTTLNQTGAAITSQRNPTNLLTTVLHILVDQIGFSHMILMVYDEERHRVIGAETAGLPQALADRWKTIEWPVRDDHSLVARMVIHGEAFLVSSMRTLSRMVYPELHSLIAAWGGTVFRLCAAEKPKTYLGLHLGR